MSSLRRTVFLFSVANFLQVTTFIAGLVTYPQFLTRVCGLSEARAGALVGLLALSNLIAVFPLGLLSDRVSPKRLLQVSYACNIAFFLLLTVVRSEWALWPVFVLGGVGFAGVRSLVPILYYKYLPDARRSSNVSLFLALGIFGFGVGGQISGAAQEVSIGLPFYLAAGLSVLMAAWSQLLPDSKPERIRLFQYVGDVFDAKVIAVTGVFLLMGLHFGVEQYGFPKLVRDGLSIDASRMGQMYLAIGLCLGCTVVLLRSFLDERPKHFYYFGIGLVVSGVFHAMVFLGEDFNSLLAVRLAHVLGDGAIILMSGVVVSSIFPSARMGGNVGFMNLVNSIGQFGGAVFAGACIDAGRISSHPALGPYVAAFTITGIIVAACGIGFIAFRKALGIAERKPGAAENPA